MAHESFEDAEVAAAMNADFVCIKVDREERPDLDAVYMNATVAMTGALSFVYPVVAIAVDRIAFGQSLAWTQVLGALLILLAAAGVNFGWRLLPRRRSARLAPSEPGASER